MSSLNLKLSFGKIYPQNTRVVIIYAQISTNLTSESVLFLGCQLEAIVLEMLIALKTLFIAELKLAQKTK